MQTEIIVVKTKIKPEQREFQIEAAFSIKPEECYVCGERKENLMPYYAKRDFIGIIRWNPLEITDSDVRANKDDGNELFGQNSNRRSYRNPCHLCSGTRRENG